MIGAMIGLGAIDAGDTKLGIVENESVFGDVTGWVTVRNAILSSNMFLTILSEFTILSELTLLSDIVYLLSMQPLETIK